MSTLSAIKDAVIEIRDFMRRELTPEFMANVKSALKAINDILGDPEVQEDIKASLRQLKELLEQANDSKIIENISNVLGDVHKILERIDPEIIDKVLAAIKNLTAGKEALQELYEKLKSVHCLRDLKEFADMLIHPSAALALGVYTPILGAVVMAGINKFLDTSNNKELTKLMKQSVEAQYQILHADLYAMRQRAMDIVRETNKMEQNPIYTISDEERQHRAESRRILSTILPHQGESLAILKSMQASCEQILIKIHQSKIDNESMTDYLEGVESDMACWEQLLEYVVYSPKLRLGKKDKPTLPRDTLNYSQIKRLYDSKTVEKIMKQLAKNFASQGGNALFSKLANSFVNSPREFLYYLKLISANDTAINFPDNEWRKPAEKLANYYRRAGADILAAWNATDWVYLGFNEKPELTTRISKVILARAYLEFTHKTAPHFYFPRNAPRELFNAVIDVPKGLIQPIIHPLNTLKGLGSLFTARGWKNIGSSAANHPVRFIGSAVAGSATGFGVSKIAHVAATSASHSAHVLRTANTLNASHSLINTNLSLSASGTIASTAGSRNNMAARGSTRHSTQSRGSNVAGLNSSPRITKRMFNELLGQLKDSKDPRVTYSEWYERSVLGRKVPVLAREYKQNMRLILASDAKESKQASSGMAQRARTSIGLFSSSEPKENKLRTRYGVTQGLSDSEAKVAARRAERKSPAKKPSMCQKISSYFGI